MAFEHEFNPLMIRHRSIQFGFLGHFLNGFDLGGTLQNFGGIHWTREIRSKWILLF